MRNALSLICTTCSRRQQTSRRRHDERTARFAPALAGPYLSGNPETAAPGWLLDGQRAPFSSCWIACPDSGLACLPSREDDVLALHGSTLCRANLARGLRVHLA